MKDHEGHPLLRAEPHPLRLGTSEIHKACPAISTPHSTHDADEFAFHTGRILKPGIIPLAGLSLLSGGTGQSSVTLYGVIDTSVRFANHRATSSGPQTLIGLQDGAFNNARWGLRGVEELGAGSKALFTLESGFSPTTGRSSQQGQLFGRRAWLGLANDTWGTIKLGRQMGAAYLFVIGVDPISIGNYSELSWQTSLTGLRYDNTVDYSKQWAGLGVEAQYAFGERAGDMASGSTVQLALTYDTDSLHSGAVAQQSRMRTATRCACGSPARATPSVPSRCTATTDAWRQAGFAIGANGSGTPLANTSIGGNANTVLGAGTQTAERRDQYAAAGVTYRHAGAQAHRRVYAGQRLGVRPGVAGLVQTVYGVAMYSLSKRTEVYLEMDYSRLSGGSITDPNNPSGSFGGTRCRTGRVGLRTRF